MCKILEIRWRAHHDGYTTTSAYDFMLGFIFLPLLHMCIVQQVSYSACNTVLLWFLNFQIFFSSVMLKTFQMKGNAAICSEFGNVKRYNLLLIGLAALFYQDLCKFPSIIFAGTHRDGCK